MGQRSTIVETNLDFPSEFQERSATNYLVVHHTGRMPNFPVTAEVIHGWHKDRGFNGIGYHYVILPDGTVERGRPRSVVGAHILGLNYCSIGIHVTGDFTEDVPNVEQLSALNNLLADLKEIYTDENPQIIGHRDVVGITGDAGYASECPGDGLYGILPTIREQTDSLIG